MADTQLAPSAVHMPESGADCMIWWRSWHFPGFRSCCTVHLTITAAVLIKRDDHGLRDSVFHEERSFSNMLFITLIQISTLGTPSYAGYHCPKVMVECFLQRRVTLETKGYHLNSLLSHQFLDFICLRFPSVSPSAEVSRT